MSEYTSRHTHASSTVSHSTAQHTPERLVEARSRSLAHSHSHSRTRTRLHQGNCSLHTRRPQPRRLARPRRTRPPPRDPLHLPPLAPSPTLPSTTPTRSSSSRVHVRTEGRETIHEVRIPPRPLQRAHDAQLGPPPASQALLSCPPFARLARLARSDAPRVHQNWALTSTRIRVSEQRAQAPAADGTQPAPPRRPRATARPRIRSQRLVRAPPLAAPPPRQRADEDECRDRLIRYCKTTRDYLVPSVWGPVQKGEDPYAPQASGGVSSALSPRSGGGARAEEGRGRVSHGGGRGSCARSETRH